MPVSELFTMNPADAGALGADGQISAAVEVDPPVLTSETIRLWQAFSPLSLERRRRALAVGALESFQAGAVCRSADEIAVVVSGCLVTGASGSDLAAEILAPGEIVATGASRTISGRWITDGELYRVSLDAWIENAGEEGLLHLLAGSDRRQAGMMRRLVCTNTHLATARVADLILAVHEAAPRPNIPLSQEQLGAMLGLRRTTVNGSCRSLETKGGTRTRRGQIRIVNAEILAQAACGCRRLTE